MNRQLVFTVTLAFSDAVTEQEDIMMVAENIARAIKNEADSGEGIAPENADVITRAVEVKPEAVNNFVTLKIY